MFLLDYYGHKCISRVSLPLIGFICGIIIIVEPVNGQVSRGLKNNYYRLEPASPPINLFDAPKGAYLITQRGIYQQKRKTLVKRYTSAAIITSAVEDDSVFWLGTQKGLLRVNKKTFSSKPVAMPLEDSQPLITTLLRDYAGTIWVGAEAYGVFKFVANRFEKVLGAFPVNAGAVTKDSSVWIGTNTGLHQLKDKQWVRYNEEGVTNFEIPDNIVEKLQVDNHDNLWVVLSEGITVFEAKSEASASDDHVPSVKFIGKPQNPIYSVIYVKQQGYVFATGMGLLFLPTTNNGHLSNLKQSSATDIVENKSMLHLIQLPNTGREGLDFSAPVLLRCDTKNNFWFVDQRGVRVLTSKNFIKLLQTAKAKIEDSPKANVLLR